MLNQVEHFYRCFWVGFQCSRLDWCTQITGNSDVGDFRKYKYSQTFYQRKMSLTSYVVTNIDVAQLCTKVKIPKVLKWVCWFLGILIIMFAFRNSHPNIWKPILLIWVCTPAFSRLENLIGRIIINGLCIFFQFQTYVRNLYIVKVFRSLRKEWLHWIAFEIRKKFTMWRVKRSSL